MAERKPMLSAEELAFIKGGDTKDNGFKKPEADTKPIVSPPTEQDNSSSKLQTVDSLVEDKERTVRFTVDLPKSMHRKLSILSAERGIKMTKFVRMAIANELYKLEEDEE